MKKSVNATALDSTNPEAEQLADSLLQAINQVAWKSSTPLPTPKPIPKPVKKATRRTRKPGTTIRPLLPVDQEIARQRKLAENSRRKIVDELEEQTVSRLQRYSNELPPELRKHVDAVREFFLTEINPVLLASSLGAAQARDVVQRLLETNVDLEPYNYFDSLMRKAVKVKLRKFVSKFTKVTQQDLQALIEQQKEVLLVNGQPTARNRESISQPLPVGRDSGRVVTRRPPRTTRGVK